MAISSIQIDRARFEEIGVGDWELADEPLDMRGLGKVVVLAGPNGGGKTRVLRSIERVIRRQLATGQRADHEYSLRAQERKLQELQASRTRKTANHTGERDDELERIEWQIEVRLKEIADQRRALMPSYLITLPPGNVPTVVSLVPTPRLIDPARSSDHAVRQAAGHLSQDPGSSGADSGAPSYAREILRAALLARDKGRRQPEKPSCSVEEQRASSLQSMVVSVLGEAFTLDLDDSLNIAIAGRSDYYKVLSPGQLILFQFACILHAQGATLANCVLFMDEPENHLHPAAISHIVERLREKITDGQLWIATHSVPLIAQLVALDSDCLWYVANSKAQRAGRNPELVLDGLMGGYEGARYINELSSLPAQFAALRFLAECLQAPAVVGPTVSDPQLTHIRSLLTACRATTPSEETPLRLLDYGAGKGRLLRELTVSRAMHIDYIAYDPSQEMIDQCRKEFCHIRTGGLRARCFSDLHLLAASVDPGSIDLVVMCNVLHEISPDEWLQLFGADGRITQLLHERGYLLIVEDYGIPTGERAHHFGFLLLDEPELRSLFQVSERDGREHYTRHANAHPRYQHRLAAHLISRPCVCRVTAESRLNAIRRLKARASDTVRSFLKSTTSDSAAGRSYALNTQLLANASLWLEFHGR